jgi:hypothetical protein
LRKQHLAEYQAFLERLAPAAFAPDHQFGPADCSASLPPVAEIRYAFRFMAAAYGSALTVDAATQRRKMLQLSGLTGEDSLLQIKEEGETLRPAYALFLDHEERRCVLAIRGTATVEDALTDTVADPVWDEFLGGYVHQGIHDAAHWLIAEVKDVLQSAAAAHPEYMLMVTGHSLGAGVAALATLLLHLKETCDHGFQTLRGIGFATPGVATLPIAEGSSAMQCFTSLVCARDGIVRTCVPNIYVMNHEVAAAATRTRLLDGIGKALGGKVQEYAERRHSTGAESAEQLSGPKCFPVGACIVLADPGEPNARALIAMPGDISKMFVHEDMASDHQIDRYELGLRCLGCPPIAEDCSLFFGTMSHEDWGEVEGQLFATETEARAKYATLSLLTASMIVNPLGEVIAYHGPDKACSSGDPKADAWSRKSEMMEWYRKACKNEVCENNKPYTCMQHLQFGEVVGWSFDSMKGARKQFKSLSPLKACMIVDKNGTEMLFYGVNCRSSKNVASSGEVTTVREDMLRSFRENMQVALAEGTVEDCGSDSSFGSFGSFHSCCSGGEQSLTGAA